MSHHGRMAVGDNDHLLYIPDRNEQVHLYLEGYNTWHIFPSEKPARMVTFDDVSGDIVMMDRESGIWEYSRAKSGWANISGKITIEPGSTPKSILRCNGTGIYLLQENGTIWVFDRSLAEWERINHAVTPPDHEAKRAIATDGFGNLYYLTKKGGIQRYDGSKTRGWTFIDFFSGTDRIAGGGNHLCFMHSDGAIYTVDAGQTECNYIGGNNQSLQVASGDAGLFQRQEDKVLKYDLKTREWVVVLYDKTTDLVVGIQTVFVKHPDGRVSMYRDGVWRRLPPVS